MSKRYAEFIFVRCSDVKTAKETGAKSPPEFIFFNNEGEEYYRCGVRDASGMDRAMEEAHKKYGPKEVTWTAYDDTALQAAKEGGKLIIIAFVDGSKESESSLKSLEDRTLVKYHEKLAFLKVEFRKDGEVEKKWGVTSALTFLVVDPSKTEKLTGKRSSPAWKKPIASGLLRIEKSGR